VAVGVDDTDVDGLAAEVLWHRGRCLSYGDGVTYWALADMMRMRVGSVEGEAPDAVAAKLADTVARFVPDPAERRWIEPRLGQLLGLGDRPTTGQDDQFAAWRLFVERMSDIDPVVLVFEDLHWADSSLLDFVDYLLEWSRNHPIFVLALSRPELAERRPTWGAGRRNFSSLYLEPLTADAMEQLLAGLVPGLPPSVAATILARAEGIPLYAVETVRMLIDQGLLEKVDDGYRPTGPIGDLQVPETLHGLIAARLDGLAGSERRLVEDAAVLGKSFTPGALAAVSGLPVDSLAELLAVLVRRDAEEKSCLQLFCVLRQRALERGQRLRGIGGHADPARRARRPNHCGDERAKLMTAPLAASVANDRGQGFGCDDPCGNSVFEVVAHVGNAIRPADHFTLGRLRGGPGPRVVAYAVEGLDAQVERRERILAGMTTGPVTAVVGERDRFGQFHVEPECPGDGRCHLGDLERVGQPGSLMIIGEHEHLRLAGQTPERAGVQDAVSIALEARAPLIGCLGDGPSSGTDRTCGRRHKGLALDVLALLALDE